ncbi:MAG: glycosyl transferase, WecB/TagA/CpsF family [Rhizobacter sp.]|nr:glycosyl transferase, WecB/TagA/CpsF family [Rhizobacter sp.]
MTATIGGCRFDPLTLVQTVDAVFDRLHSGVRGWVCTVNVAILMMMRTDPELRSFIDRSQINVADGQPLVWAAPLFRTSLPERVTGIDLIEELADRAAIEGVGLYLLGSKLGVVQECAAGLASRHPKLRIDAADGYFDAEQAAERADAIRRSGAGLLIVGMGVPRQERFIDEQWERLGVGMAIGVGGSFEVMAGRKLRAHRWIQAIGMEWLFRLIQEPRRLFWRYLSTNVQFAGLVARQMVRRLSGGLAGGHPGGHPGGHS